MELLLNTFGAKLRRSGQLFILTTEEKKRALSPRVIKRITLSTNCSISTDAVLLALDFDIPIVIIDRSGQLKGRFWSGQYKGLATLRISQLAFTRSSEGKAWYREQLRKKLQQQVALLKMMQRSRPSRHEKLKIGIEKINRIQEELTEQQVKLHLRNDAFLRGKEGNSARIYFQLLAEYLPENWHFPKRSRRPAEDPFNAILNYLYGIKYHFLESCLIESGLDPQIAAFHRITYNRSALTFDFIESFRPWCDYVACELCRTQLMNQQQHFDFDGTGVFLNREGKAVLIPFYNDYMQTKVKIWGNNTSRAQHIREQIIAFKKRIKKFRGGL